MRNVTADNITDVFMNYFGADTDPRMREVMQSLAITFTPLPRM